MEVSIRKVKNGDAPALAKIQTESWNAAFRHILSAETLEKSTQPGRVEAMYQRLLDENIGHGYLLELDGKAHCIAYWDRARDAEMQGCAEIICIHSLRERWGKGYGTKMMEKLLEDIARAGYSKVILWVFAENERARKFYEARGFAANGKEKTGLGAQELCYEKTL
ncbi:GNAT family N-acetyltransferase [Acidaminobacterium chupaoyuni]